MANLESTPKTPRRARRASLKASECIPAYGAGDGVLSFRYRLPTRERDVIDQALAIVGRCLATNRTLFATPETVKTYLQLQLSGEACEKFAVLFLDVQNRFLAFEVMAVGTIHQAIVYPREIVLAALAHGATAVVLTHNHPSGLVDPSWADRTLTQTLKQALALIDVRVLDHVIVAPGEAFSMAERGLM